MQSAHQQPKIANAIPGTFCRASDALSERARAVCAVNMRWMPTGTRLAVRGNYKRFTTIVGREARALWFAIASHNVLKPRTHKHTPTVIGAQSMRYANGNRNFEKRLMRGAKLYARRATMYTFFSGQIRDDINQQYGIYYHRKHPSLYFFFSQMPVAMGIAARATTTTTIKPNLRTTCAAESNILHS